MHTICAFKLMKKILASFIALIFVVSSTLAAPFPGLQSFYPNGLGCVMVLLECTPPSGAADGLVAFIHKPDLGYGGATLYNRAFDSTEWGNFGFLGTGINYGAGEIMDSWSTFWAPWGDPIQ